MEIELIREDQTSPELIRAAWRGSKTFAILPAKCSVDGEWLRTSLSQIPKHYSTDHFCLLSSGSTGAPKLFLGSRSRAEKLARTLHEVQDSAGVRQAILALPLSYSYAFVNQFVWTEVYGRPLIYSGGLARPGLLDVCLHEAQHAMLCLVGTQAKLLLDLFPGRRFPGVTRLHFAGGAFPQERLTALKQTFPSAAIFNNYGCIEAMPRLTVYRVQEKIEAGEIGTPIPGVELSCGEAGHLHFRSEYRAVAQLDPSGLIATPAAEWQSTGDVAEQDSNGNWRLLGRAGEVFKRHGTKVAVQQIVTTVAADWQGQTAFYREDDRVGESGYVMAVAPTPTTTELAGMLKSLRENFPRSQWPLRIESRSFLPMLPNGKLDYVNLNSLQGATPLWWQRL